jgi:hypothetical protein
MDTLTVRLSGSANATETVEGTEVNGFFLHRHLTCDYLWTVSHTQSGMNLGANFAKRRHALSFAEEVGETYNGHVSADELIGQFKTRGTKPSICELGEKHGMERW